MVVSVVFPKVSCYDRQDTDTKRIIKNLFKKYLQCLVDNDCTIEYFIEDRLAVDLINEMSIENTKMITAICKSDLIYLQSTMDEDDPIDNFVFLNYDKAICQAYNIEKRFVVDSKLLYTDRELYMKKRLEVYRKRRRTVMNEYVDKAKNILMFRTENILDRCHAVRNGVVQGDGRLCIEVSITEGLTRVYYGGVFVPDDMLPAIINAQKGL